MKNMHLPGKKSTNKVTNGKCILPKPPNSLHQIPTLPVQDTNCPKRQPNYNGYVSS